MNVEKKKIVPIGFLASLGAPFLYVGYAVFINAISGRGIDILVLVMMFASAFIFSFVATMALIAIVIGVTQLLNIKKINVPLTAFGCVLGVVAIIAATYGPERSLVFAILAFANAILFVIMARVRG